MNLLANIVNFVIYSNILISFAAVSLCLSSQIILAGDGTLYPYLLAVFFGTLCEYNLNSFLLIARRKILPKGERFDWIRSNKSCVVFLFLTSLAGVILTCLYLQTSVFLLFVIGATILFLYSTPVFFSSRKYFSLRDIKFLKIFLISFVWAFVTIAIPFCKVASERSFFEFITLFIERFLFIFAITIPFDIKDMEQDRVQKLRTIPTMIGAERANQLSHILLFLFLFLVCSRFLYDQKTDVLLASLMMFLILKLLFHFRKDLKRYLNRDLYCYGLLDGSMLLYGVLLMVFCSFC